MKIELENFRKKLHNHTERLVLETMEDLLNRSEYCDVCCCEQCLIDIASFALNRLPAKYISCPHGELQTKISEFENQVIVDVVSTVARGIKIVSSDPRH